MWYTGGNHDVASILLIDGQESEPRNVAAPAFRPVLTADRRCEPACPRRPNGRSNGEILLLVA